MELRVLENFLAVASEGSITNAAAKLHLVQPTLSKQMKDLEAELGARLLVREKRGVSLTKEGALLQKRAEELIAMAGKTEREIAAMSSQLSGDVHFGAAETESLRFIAQVFKRLRGDHPSLRMHISTGNVHDLASRFDRGAFDFAVLSEPANTVKYDYVTLPAREEWMLITRRDNPLARKASVSVEDIRNEPLIMSQQVMTRNAAGNNVAEWFGDAYRESNVVATFNLPFSAAIMAQEELGSVITFDKIIDTSESSPLCAIPLDPPLYSWLIVAWRKGHVLSEAADLFMRYLLEDLGQEPSDPDGNRPESA